MVCKFYKKAHPSVIAGREDFNKMWTIFSAACWEFKDDGDSKKFTRAVNKLLDVSNNLHLRKYLHKSNQFAKREEVKNEACSTNQRGLRKGKAVAE